jgi:polyphosphate kinase
MSNNQYFNRELSWIEFNARVIEEARDRSVPLLERLKFLAIVTTNFDEFFMVRVAALKARLRAGDDSPDASGQAPSELLASISRRTRELVALQYECFSEILPALELEGLSIVRSTRWTASERRWLEAFFLDRVFPLLTPLRVESGESFPSTGNLRVHAAFLLGDKEEKIAVVQVPQNLERFVRLPSPSDRRTARFALLNEIIASFGQRLFPGSPVREVILFKVTRDADVGVDEDRDEDFVAAMEEVLVGRQNSYPIRMTVFGESERLEERIRESLGLDPDDVYRLPGPIDLRGFLELVSPEGPAGSLARERLRDDPWPPLPSLMPAEGSTVWDEIDKSDLLLHVPYESFDPVVRLVEEAAADPAVLAIKMTLYRTSGNSPIARALTRAARDGKQVAVLVELKARFDEEQNIGWASRLEQAGAIVVYGLARLKVHAKAALVVRRAPDGAIRRYLHLSTGNYNERTARLYADLSLFTADAELCREASVFFNIITGYSTVHELARLAVAPFDLKRRILSMIEREIQRSSPESPGLIMAKLNALADTEIIDALYKASRAGVKVLLNVRGVCTLVPGIEGMSDNIEVVSVVGRYLEHARIVRFGNGGSEEIYLSSADWLPRNLERRVELMFPILDEALRGRVRGVLEAYFRDNAKAHRLAPDGRWERVSAAEGEEPFSAQAYFYTEAKLRLALSDGPAERLQVRRRPG